MKKVLIITYYWPPSGGSGVQRWLKFVKYLPELGYEPHIFTPENPDFDIVDNSLEKDIPKEAIIIKNRIFEPYGIYRFLLGKNKTKGANFGLTNNKKSSIFQKLALWVRSNLFIPDPRVFWVRPSVKLLKQYIIDNNINQVITTGPPHSVHLIGLALKKHFKNDINWLTDFRDPWTKMFNIGEFSYSNFALKKIAKQEKDIINNCDKLLTVSKTIQDEFDELGSKGKSECIYNGFDVSDFSLNDEGRISSIKKFTISYIGLLPKLSNPKMLWKTLEKLIIENKEFKEKLELIFVGKIDPEVINDIKKSNLLEFCSFKGIVPHNEAVNYQFSSDLLLLLVPNVPNSRGILTGKFFEYLASKSRILAIGDVLSEVGEILRESKTGEIFEYTEVNSLEKFILTEFNNTSKNDSVVSQKQIEKFSRKNLTIDLVSFLKEV